MSIILRRSPRSRYSRCRPLFPRFSRSERADEVATRAGVGSGSFYQYFPDRPALIGALIDRQLAAEGAPT